MFQSGKFLFEIVWLVCIKRTTNIHYDWQTAIVILLTHDKMNLALEQIKQINSTFFSVFPEKFELQHFFSMLDSLAVKHYILG